MTRGGDHITGPRPAVGPHVEAARIANRRYSAEGRAYARRWRETQPFKAMLDAIYGAELPAGNGRFPYPGHRNCAEW